MSEIKVDEEVLLKQGYLEKKGVGALGVGAGWKRRYFHLRAKVLDYFDNEEETLLRGSINLKDITKINIEKFHLDLQDQTGRLWQLHADSEADAQSWYEAIRLQVMG